jgi:hypothetical protein
MATQLCRKCNRAGRVSRRRRKKSYAPGRLTSTKLATRVTSHPMTKKTEVRYDPEQT